MPANRKLDISNSSFEKPSLEGLDGRGLRSSMGAVGLTGLPWVDGTRKLDAQTAELKRHSLEDELTGCYNRRFFEKYKKENFDHKKHENIVGFVFIDINGLKEVNDQYGHDAGNKLIKQLADYLKETVYNGDFVVRYGGDEFVLICHNSTGWPDFEDGLCTSLQDRLVKNSPVSIACGCAVYNNERDGGSIEATQHLADTRMYENKQKVKAALSE